MTGWLNTSQLRTDRPPAEISGAAKLAPGEASLHSVWAHTPEQVLSAQRLRYQVFAQEMGAHLEKLPGTPSGVDADPLDTHCEHLLVIAKGAQVSEVVGTYRVLTPQAAQRAQGLYTASEFDIAALTPLQPQLVELGRSCVHPDWRTGGVIMKLWAGLTQFMVANDLRYMLGCASMSMKDGGHEAARLWGTMQRNHLSDACLRVHPRLPLPVDQLQGQGPVEPPPLIKGYLSLGARVLGPPAWDPAFGTADFPMLLDLHAMTPAFRTRLMRAA